MADTKTTIAVVGVSAALITSAILYKLTTSEAPTPQPVVRVYFNIRADRFYRVEFSTNMVDWFETDAIAATDISGVTSGVAYYQHYFPATELPGSVPHTTFMPVSGGTGVIAQILLNANLDQGFVRLREQTPILNPMPPRIVYF